MLNFVNHGTDEAILKSLPIDGASDELIKAMGKQGLVQKDYRGGNTVSKYVLFTKGEFKEIGKSELTQYI